MPQTTLKKLIGDGGAGLDQSHGSDWLRKVLADICNEKRVLGNAYLGTVATGILNGGSVAAVRPDGSKHVRKPVLMSAELDVCGSAGSTTVQFRVNGVSVASITFANTDPDPSTKTVAITTQLNDGDYWDINVSAAPTGGTGLRVTVYETVGPIDVEP